MTPTLASLRDDLADAQVALSRTTTREAAERAHDRVQQAADAYYEARDAHPLDTVAGERW